MNCDNKEELFPLVDETGKVIGKATRGKCHDGSKLLHPVVHLHLFDTKGRLYLQKRPEWKDIQPGKWDTAVGGHVDYGEEVEDALLREAKEEIGIEDFEYRRIRSYVFESDREKEYVNVFTTVTDVPVRPTSELDGGRFWEIAEIVASLDKDMFTPNFSSEFRDIILPQLENIFN